MNLVELNNMSAGYGKNTVIEDISFSISAGEMVGILGLNGCGKSTLVKAICNVLPHKGEVKIEDKILEDLHTKEAARLVSYIPQKSGVSIDIPVLDVVMMGFNPWLSLLERPGKEMEDKAISVLEQVGLADMIHANYMELSEGQKQLVIIARALVSDGKLLLMDEPESALDFSVRYKAMGIVRSRIRNGEKAGLVILHDIALALNTCDRLVLLKDKKIAAVVDIHRELTDSMEEKLNCIYGNLLLKEIRLKSGKESFVVMYDAEEI